jgi:hypothetical protein
MGNSQESATRRRTSPPVDDLNKGYNCYYYSISSFPDSFKYEKCVVEDHNYNKTLYNLHLESDSNIKFINIPYFYVSGRQNKRSWYDYFKVGTMVQTNMTAIDRANNPSKRRAEIMDVRTDKNFKIVVDLRDVKTGYTAFGVTPDKYLLDLGYYRDW